MQFRKKLCSKKSVLLADVIIVCRDHKSCVFDGISNTNALGIPADGTADKKFESFVLLY